MNVGVPVITVPVITVSMVTAAMVTRREFFFFFFFFRCSTLSAPDLNATAVLFNEVQNGGPFNQSIQSEHALSYRDK